LWLFYLSGNQSHYFLQHFHFQHDELHLAKPTSENHTVKQLSQVKEVDWPIFEKLMQAMTFAITMAVPFFSLKASPGGVSAFWTYLSLGLCEA
jgi:hypothetical protein